MAASALHPPSLLLTLAEARVMWEATRAAARWPWRRGGTLLGGAPVLVVPGLLANDTHTWPLRRQLEERGFAVYPWELGFNRGPRRDVLRRLAARVRWISRRHRQPVRIVGWSLGGLLARVAASRARDCVAQVVTLGSPLSGDPRCSRLGPVLRAVGGPLDARRVRRLLREGATMPVTSIYSRSDGVVAWQASAPEDDNCRAIAVDSTHLGMVLNPDVLEVVAQQLTDDAARDASVQDDRRT